MNEGRSEDFQKHFAVTHFFNPPRYLKLFEVVPDTFEADANKRVKKLSNSFIDLLINQ